MEPSPPFRAHAAELKRHLLARRPPPSRPRDRYWLHLLLFLLTLASTTYAGMLLVGRDRLYDQFGLGLAVLDGFRYAAALLFFLTVHEFGHFFAARRHGVATSLPYYIPFPFNIIGNFGALIRIREPVPSMRTLFDIGAAGPIAGFVAAAGVLLYALAALPPPEYMLDVGGHEALHAYIQQTGRFPEAGAELPANPPGTTLTVGSTLLYWLLSQAFPNVPPMFEIYHYPLLFAGWLGLFFTALNLLPVGQLDGGHILYALVGPRWHGRLARGFVILLLASGAVGFMHDVPPVLEAYAGGLAGLAGWILLSAILYGFLHRIFDGDQRRVAPVLCGLVLLVLASQMPALGPLLAPLAYTGWLIWCLLIVALIRVDHPPVLYEEPLTPRRRLLGIASMVIFVLCFSFRPLYFG